MLKLRNLLLPVDYSTRCLDAADCARLLGSRSPVKVTILHVTDARARRRANEEVIRAFSDRMAGLDVQFHEVPGGPAEEIIEHSRKKVVRVGLIRLLGEAVSDASNYSELAGM